ncbi:MAG: hypothetical protein A2163_06000 [Actinobacteria bacterium RBG_13_35_12]|uniref:Uncharacterized protein n=1 Tax=Candidatus Sediminicultor quintus TaxID=1797291 RepID=A0A1F5ABX3_9BACT|nr:MAG: hypothetical protein A2163_06000 [Actinobacteria bacterium RBG_13_35_12]OGD15404.1 MAG: hypothetical protein A2V47_02565 [Candidatus Atribacteria bacterium RBG_19FT_COMBO_35_14]
MKNISNEVFKKIQDNNIIPKPRWYFITKNYFIWSIFGISIILGSLAFSMVLFIIEQLDWDIYHYIGDSFLKTVFISLPYLWLIFLILFTGAAYYNFIHTKRGYRFKFISILLISLIISITLGTGLYFNGFSERLENVFSEKIPYYNRLVYSFEKQWMKPERGLLAGIIIETGLPENNFILMDLDNNRWKIEAGKAIWKGKMTPVIGLKIKLIGKLIDDSNFKAIEIRSWQQSQGRFMMGGNR